MTRDRALLLAGSTIAFGVSTLMRKLAVKDLHPLQFQATAALIYALLFPMFMWMWFKYGDGSAWTMRGGFWTLACTLVAMAAAIVFMFVLRGANDTGVVSVLVSASPIITLALSAILLGEQLSFKSIAGVGFVFAGILLVSGK